MVMKLTMAEKQNSIAFIQLKGKPYQHLVKNGNRYERVDCNATLNALAKSSGYVTSLPIKIRQVESELQPLYQNEGYYGLDQRLMRGEDLSFKEAFSAIAFVCSALNRPLRKLLADRIQNLAPLEVQQMQAAMLLKALSAKESFQRLTSEEIAGMLAATISLDTVVRLESQDKTLVFGGMGGDRGYKLNGQYSKLFSISTLSAIASAVIGPTHKNHSYPNTSKIAGQSAIEAFGARSDINSVAAFQGISKETGLLMTSGHSIRTLNTLSHKVRGETINHVIGPTAFPVSQNTSLQGFIGVNEKVHPKTMIDAMLLLDQYGYQTYDDSVVYCGTDLVKPDAAMFDPDKYYASRSAKAHVVLDEIAPPPFISLVAFSVGRESAGTYVLFPEDFFTPRELHSVRFQDLAIPNDREQILRFNREAITGQDEEKSRYLAMTIGLGIFIRRYLRLKDALNPYSRRVNSNLLRTATNEGFELLKSGRAEEKLAEYVAATQRYGGQADT